MSEENFEEVLEHPPPTTGSTTTQVFAVSLKLPPFWPKQATMWFTTVEAQFSLRKITEDQTKFEYALTALDADTQERVADFFDDLPAAGKRYTEFKKRVLDSFKVNQFQRLATLVNLSIGDDSPSRLLDRMLGLYRPDADAAKSPLFRYHFVQKLPAHVRDQVAAADHLQLRDLAKLADKIFAQRQASTVLAVQEEAEVDAVQRQGRGRPNGGASSKTQRVCRFHAKFGEQARSCLMPCSWNGKVAPAPRNGSAGRQ